MRLNKKGKWLVVLSFIFDIIISCGGIYLAEKIQGVFGDTHDIDYRYILAFGGFILFFFVMYDLYSVKAENIYNTLISVGLSIAATDICVFLLSFTFKDRCQDILFWILAIAITGCGLILWRAFIALTKKKVGEKRKWLIVENMNNTSRLARKLKYASNIENLAWYHMLDEDNEDEIQKLIDKKIAMFDVIFISPSVSKDIASKIMFRALMLEKDVDILADVYSVTTLKGKIYQIDDTPVIEKKGIQLTKMQKFVKRGFDVIFAILMGLITSPIFLISALAIKLDSPGPIIYKQERYTRYKKTFNVYKFRTMVADAEKDGAQFATESDPRITKVGKLLRAMRIDELPQIYNILFGSMSVVGPRPERPVFADEFSKQVSNYDMRYCLKAGLTGYAQVYGKYNTRVSDKILMDMIYGTTYSFLLDIKIILLTIKIMFVKSATEGVDDELDSMLNSDEKEEERRNATLEYMEGDNEENIYHYTGI